jgi:small subunit ribosomal protein S20
VRKNKSAIKRALQSERRRLRNSHVRSTMKTAIKKALSAIKEKDATGVETVTKAAIACIDKTASKGVIHRNQAARRVSRLAKKANKVLTESVG